VCIITVIQVPLAEQCRLLFLCVLDESLTEFLMGLNQYECWSFRICLREFYVSRCVSLTSVLYAS